MREFWEKMKITKRAYTTGLIIFIVVGYSFLFYLQQLDGTAISPVYEFPKDTLITDFPDTTHMKNIGAYKNLIGTYSIKTDKSLYAPGEMIYVSMSFCKFRSLDATIQWSFLDGTVITLPEEPDQFTTPACYNNVLVPTVRVPIEAKLKWSEIHLQGYTSVKVNSLRTIVVGYQSNVFFVQ
jgi:hypothetical protein